MIDNLNFIYPEIFISLSIMFLLLLGVFKKNSTSLIYNLSIVFLIFTLALIFNYPQQSNVNLFNDSYKIDYFSSFMKILTICSGIFVLVTSSRYLKIFKYEYVKSQINNALSAFKLEDSHKITQTVTEQEKEETLCPVCKNKLIFAEGCNICIDCGYRGCTSG